MELVAGHREGVGFNVIAAHLGVSKATTSRLLAVLRERGYVVKEVKTGRYLPGPRMSLLNNSLPVVEVLRRELPQVLESLMDSTCNTCLFIFWNGHELQCLDKRTHQGSVPMQEVGHIDTALTAGPWGWLVYESLNNAERENAKLDLERHPDCYEIFNSWKLFYDKHHFCYDDQQFYKPLRRLAAPVKDNNGKLLGALAVGGNSLTIRDDQVLIIGEKLKKHAEELMSKI